LTYLLTAQYSLRPIESVVGKPCPPHKHVSRATLSMGRREYHGPKSWYTYTLEVHARYWYSIRFTRVRTVTWVKVCQLLRCCLVGLVWGGIRSPVSTNHFALCLVVVCWYCANEYGLVESRLRSSSSGIR
jgi:hypothetical protein